MTRVPFTTTWIEQGKILAGSIPQLPEDLEVLKSMGVRNIFSLTRRNIDTYPNVQDWLNINHFIWRQYPVPDGGIDNASLLRATEDIALSIDTGLVPLYLHCRGGVGRTGTVLLAYYILYRGLTLAQAKDIVKVRRNYEGNASAIDQGSPQKEWIDALEARIK